ncbi:MAG: N-6 DNA methylase, partial [Fimbriimonadales bacterium]|nr:N-6 DNA methylase [Fimbriimonadales bacterium]
PAPSLERDAPATPAPSLERDAPATPAPSLERDAPATQVYILDPACGTGSFLAHILQFVRDYLHTQGLGGRWNDETRADLVQRLFGFELLMAPYVIAHLKLGLTLHASQHLPRLGVYLTNTLELPSEQIPMHLGPWRILSEEALHASRVKRETPILVVIGNPPYSGHSANQVEWLEALLRRDYYPKDARKEQNPKMLLDDYVKFIRWAQWRLEQTGQGILAFITNHSYLDNPTFRQMRRALMDAFDALYILDLHGNIRRKETAPDGSKDENVFDIQQGVAILLAVKRASNADRLQSDADRFESDADRLQSDADRFDAAGVRGACAVYHAELWGRRAQKYAFLKAHDVSNTPWRALAPQPPLYLFVPYDATLQAEYEQGWLLTDIFRVHSTGVKTHRDHFVIDFDRATLERRIREFRDLSIPDATLRQRYHLSDTRDWKLTPNRQRLASDTHWQAYFQPILYRPFDVRWIYYTPMVVELPREEVMGHMLREANVALITTRQTKEEFGAFVTDKICRHKAISVFDIGYLFPLYLYHEEVGADGVVRVVRESNLRAEFVRALETRLVGAGSEPAPTPESILAYIYAVLHAPRYRARYAEFLRRDFPRIPLPQSAEQFYALAALGQELIDYHLLRHPNLTRSPVKFPVAGSNRVEKGFPRYEGGRVWINKTQYFEGIDEAVWRFQVGGYQVCDKWLKDRRERTLSNAEIQTYRQMAFALQETIRLMKAIDE